MRRIRVLLALVGAVAASAALAFPDKPVRLVVPYPSGGATDTAARLVAERLTAKWGHPVIVDNRPGATGAIGTEFVARSASDGYTLLLQVPILLSTEIVRPTVNYRTLRDLVPVTTVFTTPIAYLASSSAPKGGLLDIVAAGKAAPGSLDYGNHGEGTTTHYLGEMLKKAAGIQMTAVPYNGDNPIMVDLLGAHLKTGFLSGQNAKKAAETGKVRILAVTSGKRSPLMPTVPTFQEAGLEGFDRESWGKIFAPQGTPGPIVEQIARDVTQIVRAADVQSQFGLLGFVGMGGTPAETLKEVQAEYVSWIRLVREFGVLSKP